MISEMRATDVYKMGLGCLKHNSSIGLNQFHFFTSSSKSTTISSPNHVYQGNSSHRCSSIVQRHASSRQTRYDDSRELPCSE